MSFAFLQGISLEQFKAFHVFLNNIEDFVIAINMTNLLNQPVYKGKQLLPCSQE